MKFFYIFIIIFFKHKKKNKKKMGFSFFIFSYFLRVLISNSVNTYLHPDEFWQSVEPAHLNVFGFFL